MKKNSILGVHDCYGCGICAVICPKQNIRIELNKDGFYEPVILNPQLCVNCGACVSTCAYLHNDLANDKKEKADFYAAWSSDKEVRRACSAGGVAFELGRLLIAKGYKACGVRYNPKLCRAEHFIAETEEDFKASIGSKYLQSYTLDAFLKLDGKDKVFVVGTPCQIDSLRRYIRLKKIEEQFVLVDFFCHGVPSMLMWKRYLEMVEKQIGRIASVSWRSKARGWQDSITITAKPLDRKNGEWFSSSSKGDWFFRMFLADACLGRACYGKCKYGLDSSSADIRIGDFWGNKYRENEEGISALAAFTEKGKETVRQLDRCVLTPETFAVVAEGQKKRRPAAPLLRKYLIRQFRKKAAFDKAARVLELQRNIWRALRYIRNFPRMMYRLLIKIKP